MRSSQRVEVHMFWTQENTEGLADEELRTINEVRAILLDADPRIDAHAIDDALTQSWRRHITKQELFLLVASDINGRADEWATQ
jgi:hypothetical protein